MTDDDPYRLDRRYGDVPDPLTDQLLGAARRP
jgi:hypothetical protein